MATQNRRQPNEAMERRDELRQCRHLNAKGDEGADGAANQDAHDDERVTHDVGRGERRGDRNHHADDAENVAQSRAFRRGEAAQGQDEANRSDEVGDGCEIARHEISPAYFVFFLNICSMR